MKKFFLFFLVFSFMVSSFCDGYICSHCDTWQDQWGFSGAKVIQGTVNGIPFGPIEISDKNYGYGNALYMSNLKNWTGVSPIYSCSVTWLPNPGYNDGGSYTWESGCIRSFCKNKCLTDYCSVHEQIYHNHACPYSVDCELEHCDFHNVDYCKFHNNTHFSASFTCYKETHKNCLTSAESASAWQTAANGGVCPTCKDPICRICNTHTCVLCPNRRDCNIVGVQATNPMHFGSDSLVETKNICTTHKSYKIATYSCDGPYCGKKSDTVTHAKIIVGSDAQVVSHLEKIWQEEFLKCGICDQKTCPYITGHHCPDLESCSKQTCSVHGVPYCTVHNQTHFIGTLAHGGSNPHVKCFTTKAEADAFSIPTYCDWCEQAICSICNIDHSKCGKCFNEGGTGMVGCIEKICPKHKLTYCSLSSHNPQHFVFELTHYKNSEKTSSITHVECYSTKEELENMEDGGYHCDYCGEIKCPFCNYPPHTGCGKCLNQENGTGLPDCVKQHCDIHNKDYCSVHQPRTHFECSFDHGTMKHPRCFKTQSEQLDFMKRENCEYCGKIKCPVCLGHETCATCTPEKPCTEVSCAYCAKLYCIKHGKHTVYKFTDQGKKCVSKDMQVETLEHVVCFDDEDKCSEWKKENLGYCTVCGRLKCPVCKIHEVELEKECPERDDCEPFKSCDACGKSGCMKHDPHFSIGEFFCQGEGYTKKNSGKPTPVNHNKCFKTKESCIQYSDKFIKLEDCDYCGVYKCPVCGHSCECPYTPKCKMVKCGKKLENGKICQLEYCETHTQGCIHVPLEWGKCPNAKDCKVVTCDVIISTGGVCGYKYCKTHQRHKHNPDGSVTNGTIEPPKEIDLEFAKNYPSLVELKDKLLPKFDFVRNSGNTDPVLTFTGLGVDGIYTTDVMVDFGSDKLNIFRRFCRSFSIFIFALSFIWLCILALRQW